MKKPPPKRGPVGVLCCYEVYDSGEGFFEEITGGGPTDCSREGVSGADIGNKANSRVGDVSEEPTASGCEEFLIVDGLEFDELSGHWNG